MDIKWDEHTPLSPTEVSEESGTCRKLQIPTERQEDTTYSPSKGSSDGMKLTSVPNFPGLAVPLKLANPQEITAAPGCQELSSRCLLVVFPRWGPAPLPPRQRRPLMAKDRDHLTIQWTSTKRFASQWFSQHRRCSGAVLSTRWPSLPRFSGCIGSTAKQNRVWALGSNSCPCSSGVWSAFKPFCKLLPDSLQLTATKSRLVGSFTIMRMLNPKHWAQI